MATVGGIRLEAGVRYSYATVWAQLHQVAKEDPSRPDLQSWFGAPTPPPRDQVWPGEPERLSTARKYAESAAHDVIRSVSQHLFGTVQESAFAAVAAACKSSASSSTEALPGVLLYGGLHAGDNNVYNARLEEYLISNRCVGRLLCP